MKKAFTLIELLAVIIILAIVALIATPIILDVIDESQKSANFSQAYLLLDGAEQMYANSFLNEEQDFQFSGLENIDVYDKLITSGEKPENGDLFIRSNGEIAFVVYIDDDCFKKGYDDKEISYCTEGVLPEDPYIPEKELGLSRFESIEVLTDTETWKSNDSKIEIENYGYEWKYCVSDAVCIPDQTTEKEEIPLAGLDTNYVCVDLFDEGVKIVSKCDTYFIDKTEPVITPKDGDIAIMKTQSFLPLSYFTYSFGGSGGDVSCNIEETSVLPLGPNKITCTATSNSGLTTIATKDILVNELVVSSDSCFTFNSYSKSISGYKTTCGLNPVIPAQISGVDVEVISDAAFIRSPIISIVLPEKLKTIKRTAFYDSSLQSVIIPDTVTLLEDGAFQYSELQYVKLPNGYETIEIVGEEEVVTKHTVSIKNSVFDGAKIKSVIIPDGVTSIGGNTFLNNQITSFKIGTGITSLGNVFANNQITEVVIPSHITSLSGTFSGNPLEQVLIESENITIGSGTFGGVMKQVEIKNADGVVDNSFGGSIQTLIIGDKTTKIVDNAFSSNGIENLILSDSVVSIGQQSFQSNGIKNLVLGNGLKSIGVHAFTTNLLVSIVIPDSVTSISNYAFSLNQLESISIGKGLTSLPASVFGMKTGQLGKLTIPVNVSSINQYAFSNKNFETIVFDGRSKALSISGGWGANTKILCDGLKPC